MVLFSFIKRFVPFIAAFAMAVFITSLFVDIRPNRRQHDRRAWRCAEMNRENEALRQKLIDNGIDPSVNAGDRNVFDRDMVAPVPPPAFAPPAPPVPFVHRHKNR